VAENGVIAPFSSRGLVDGDGSGRIKPDLSAPGAAVYSSYVGGGYGYLWGTSMASPHVAGAAALLWSAAPALIGQIDLTEQVLIKSADPVVDGQCDPAATSPNNVYGYGRLDIYAGVLMATNPATVTITYAGADGLPIADTALTVTDQHTGYTRTLTTGPDGQATLAPIYAGAYTVAPSQPTIWEITTSAPFTVAIGENAGVTLTHPYAVLIMPIYRVSSVE
jgi:subtilisin family serine protease